MVDTADLTKFHAAIQSRGFTEMEQPKLYTELALMHFEDVAYVFSEDSFRELCRRAGVEYRGPANTARPSRMRVFQDDVAQLSATSDAYHLSLRQRAEVLYARVKREMGQAGAFAKDFAIAENGARIAYRRHVRHCLSCQATHGVIE
jgi:hypothetical protein